MRLIGDELSIFERVCTAGRIVVVLYSTGTVASICCMRVLSLLLHTIIPILPVASASCLVRGIGQASRLAE